MRPTLTTWPWSSPATGTSFIETHGTAQTVLHPFVFGPMFRLPPCLRPAIAGLIALSLVSCAQTTSLYRAPGFNPGVLAIRGVRIGTFTSEAPGPNLGMKDQSDLINALNKTLAAKGNKIFLTPSTNGLILNATLTRNDVDRWLSDDSRQVQEPVYNKEGKVTGYIVRDVFITIANVRRSVEGRFELIDPHSRNVLWSWTGASTADRSQNNESSFVPPPPPPFPDPPSTSEVATALVRTAVRKLTSKN
jgi:hypothetical protein